MQIEKFKYNRSKKLLQNVAALPCQSCGSEEFVQAAHSNQQKHGKGRSIKASDEFTAALCLKCHYEIDQGKNLSKEERQEKWLKAHKNTVALLLVRGEWPENVPVPQWDA